MDDNYIKQKLLEEQIKHTQQFEIHTRLLEEILKQLEDGADTGEYYLVQGTATTSIADNLIDIPNVLGSPEMKVSSYMIINDGAVNNLRVGHNVTKGMVDTTGVLVGQARNKFYNVLPGENIRLTYNRRVIENIYIITNAATSAYRLWLLW